MREQDITLRSYEENWESYVSKSVQIECPPQWFRWVRDAYDCSPGRSVLEIGSAAGLNATYLESLGAQVQRTEVVDAFRQYLTGQGHKVKKLNILTDPPAELYDMVFAAAVFHHFTDDEFRVALEFARESLRPGGILAFAVRRGEGEEWETSKLGSPRYFRYRQPWDPCVEMAGLKVFATETQDWSGIYDTKRGHRDWPDQWVMVIAQR